MRMVWGVCLLVVGCGDDSAVPDGPLTTMPDAPADAPLVMPPDANPLLREPFEYLPRIYDGAKNYWESLPAGSPKQFPPSVGPAPAATCCGFPGAICPPDSTLWTSQTWQDLQFHIDVPESFQYDFQSGGADATATFVAHAYGDLDCDTILSTYEIHGTIDADGGVVGGVITSTNPDE